MQNSQYGDLTNETHNYENEYKRWLQPPIFEGDEAKTRRASLLNTISILILLYLNVVIAANLIGGRIPISVTLLDILLVLVILLMRSFLWRGNITLVGGVMAIPGFLLITVVNAMLEPFAPQQPQRTCLWSSWLGYYLIGPAFCDHDC